MSVLRHSSVRARANLLGRARIHDHVESSERRCALALIACKECGNQVAGSAATCPKCGVAYPGGAGQLVISRSTALTGAMYAVKVVIDGQNVGEIAKGGAATFELLAGPHRVEVSGGGLSNAATIQIIDGVVSRYHLDFSAFGALGGGLKFKPV
jgi:hypothetical protein